MPNSNMPISLARYEQLCNFNVPYYGYIKNADGTTTMLVETEINNHCWTIDGGISYWTKEIQVTMLEFKHIVGYKETPDNIAKALGISVEQVLGILPKKPATPVGPPTKESVNKITPMPNNASDNTNIASRAKSQFFAGQEIKIKLNKKFGYQANFMVDEGYFQQYRNRNLHQAIADNTLYKVSDYLQNTVDNFASSLSKYAGKSTFGFGGRLGICVYIEKPSGGVFWGNQNLKLWKMETLGKSIQQWICPHGIPALAFLFQGFEVGEGIFQDGGMFGQNAWIQTTGAAAGIFGGIGGGTLGAWILGRPFFFNMFGIPGKIVGGIVGGIMGGNWAEKVAEEKVRTMFQSSSGKMQQMSEKEIEEFMKSSKAGYWD